MAERLLLSRWIPLAQAMLAGLIAFGACAFVSHLRPTPYCNYVLLADAFLHGHAWINWPGEFIDALEYNGRRYVIEAPIPAVLLMPMVALFGPTANQTLFAGILTGLAIAAAWELVRCWEAPWPTRAWLCAFLLAGTDLLWCAMSGAVWFLAHISSVLFTLLTLGELRKGKRIWLAAVCAACAAGSRFSLALAIPAYLALLASDEQREQRGRKLAIFCATLVPFVALWVAYNELRWHVPYDIGYTAWYHVDPVGQPTGSPFDLQYLPDQLYSFFVRAPQAIGRYPYLVPTYNGVALTWTSPALLLALRASRPRNWVTLMLVAAAFVAVPSMLYYVNGSVQFGMRHALDFEPFLFVLMAIALKPGISWYGIALCAYSILCGIWGIWYWIRFYPPI